VQHVGGDSTFKLVWLFGNTTNYIPEDAQDGMCQMFNLDPPTSDGLDSLSACLAGQNEADVCNYYDGFGVCCSGGG